MIKYLQALPILLLLMLSACTSPEAMSTVTASLPEPSITPTPKAANTLVPLATQVPETSTTSIPTYSLDEAYQQITNWVEDNGGCQLPCVWGFRPGQTDHEQIQQLHSVFDDMYLSETVGIWVDDFDDQGIITLIYHEGDVQTNIDMLYYFRGEEHIKFLSLLAKSFEVIESETGKELRYIFGNEELLRFVDEYTLSGVLNRYGIPTSILIAPYFNERPGSDPGWIWYSIVLIYEEQGILAEYIMPRRMIGDNFAACVNQNLEISIITWDSTQPIKLEEILSTSSFLGIGESMIDYFKPLEEATTLTVESFTEIFQDHETDACVYTPMELWPGP